jgi:methionyl-tRNA synthetase
MNDYYYITTPIYYVNDAPHIGHAYTTIAADVMARFMRLSGHDTFFLTGTDEHGQKVAKSAEKAGVSPQEICDRNSQHFRRLVQTGENLLNVSNDDFIRTTEERHKKAAQELWRRIEANGYIYKDNYGGWYAVRDEAYYGENELVERDGKKLAPTGAEVEWVEEESYFFKLSAFEDQLLKLYESDFVHPQSRSNEVASFVKSGLRDLSISRTTFDWGIPVPGDESHVMYVWIDALTNYLTALGWPEGKKDLSHWERSQSDSDAGGGSSAKRGIATHIVGKDILRFHAVYWPAFLMAADLPVPNKVVAHGWWTIEGEKMSKSIGNVISPDDMVKKAGGIDPLRYFLLKAMPFGNDGDFSESRMIETVNADLANNIGNLAQRTLSMIQKNCEGKVPEFDPTLLTEADKEVLNWGYITHANTTDAERQKMEVGKFHEVLPGILEAAAASNNYIDKQEPWKLKKENPERMKTVLYHLAENVRCIAIMLQPFCPDAAAKLLDQLRVPQEERYFENLTSEFALKAGVELPKPEGVFPRLQAEEKAA